MVWCFKKPSWSTATWGRTGTECIPCVCGKDRLPRKTMARWWQKSFVFKQEQNGKNRAQYCMIALSCPQTQKLNSTLIYIYILYLYLELLNLKIVWSMLFVLLFWSTVQEVDVWVVSDCFKPKPDVSQKSRRPRYWRARFAPLPTCHVGTLYRLGKSWAKSTSR